MSYRERQRLTDIQAAIEAIRSHLRRGDLSDGLESDAVVGGEWHWHGAGPDHFMAHLSLTEGDTEWGDQVTDAEYDSD